MDRYTSILYSLINPDTNSCRFAREYHSTVLFTNVFGRVDLAKFLAQRKPISFSVAQPKRVVVDLAQREPFGVSERVAKRQPKRESVRVASSQRWAIEREIKSSTISRANT